MSKLSLFTLTTLLLVVTGCSGKKYYDPLKTSSDFSIAGNILSILGSSRDGATLINRKYISKGKVSSIRLRKGYRYLSENDNYVLSANTEGILNIRQQSTGKIYRAVALHLPIVSATVHNGVVAYVLNNNTFGIYRIADNKKLIENRSERTFAIDTRAASPLFVENMVVIPMLDGKVIILDSKNSENIQVVYLSSNKVFNNVIYLGRMKNTLVATTPNKLITIGGQGKNEFTANISEIALSRNNIYVFTKEGEIIRLSDKLQEIKRKKFKFAHFSVATAFDGKVYALDQQGSLIVLSEDLSKHKVYDIGAVKRAAFISNTKLYKDTNVIELSTLGYE